MDNRYNFSSPGAAASDALLQFLAQREAQAREQKQQEFLNNLRLQQEARANEEIALRQQEQKRLAEDSQRNFDALQYDREDNRIGRQADDDIPGDVIDPATAEMRRKHGYGGTIRTIPGTLASRSITGVVTPTSGAPILSNVSETQNAGTPEQIIARGGSRYLQAAAQAQARAELAKQQQDARDEQARQSREAAAERANEANQTRLLIASGNQSAANQRAQMNADAQAQRAQEKKDEKAKEDDLKRQAALSTADGVKYRLDQLIDAHGNLRSGVADLYGPSVGWRFVPGSNAANADAAVRSLVSNEIVNLMSEMKRQSRTGATGFGQLSEKELAVLTNAATTLGNRYISDDAAKQELLHIRQILQKVYDGPAPTGTTTSGGFKVTEIK